jgi:hypothetical protein
MWFFPLDPALPSEDQEKESIMKLITPILHRAGISGPAILLIVAISAACNHSTPTEPVGGPGPVGPIGPQGSGIDGSGLFVEEDRPISGVAGIRLLSVASVFVEQGGSESLMVRADDNVISHVLTEVPGDVLELSMEAGVSFNNIGPIQVFVTVRDLSSVEIDGVGSIEVMSLSFGELHLALSGTGDMNLSDLDGESLEVEMDGVGQIVIAGQVTEQTVRVFGVGDYKAKRLASVRADVSVHNVGSATVRVSEYLAATVTGLGSIYYYGSPTVESDITGSGSVVQQGG